MRDVLAQANADQPKGTLKSPPQTCTLDTKDKLAKPDACKNPIIACRNGSPVRISDKEVRPLNRYRGAMAPSVKDCANALSLTIISISLCGCGRSAAPSFEIVGAYFPAWMFCALFGIVAAAGARAAFVSSGLSSVLPYQLFVCTSVGVIFALLLWLIKFG